MNEMWIIDAFTSQPFRGNAAAVCLMEAFPEDCVMQIIAAQNNLSETAFAVATQSKRYNLRWFTPETEVNLCGHATLATAHMLAQMGHIGKGDTVRFDTLSGELQAKVLGTSIELDFPTLAGMKARPHAALKALGVTILECERNRDNYLVEVENFAALQACTPIFRTLARMDLQGVIVTTATGVEGFDFASRYFCPGLGIDEDPVTGSAHCFLAPYWSTRLGKTRFHALQASKGHGILDVTLQGDRTLVAGQARTSLKGTIPSITLKEAAC